MLRKMNLIACVLIAVVIGALGVAVQSASATQLSDAIMALSPVGYWQFENNLADSSGNGNALTAIGTTGFAGSKPLLGNAADLSSAGFTTGFYVDTPGGSAGNALNLVGNTLSINAWINTADAPGTNPRTMQPISKQRATPWSVTAWDYGLWMEATGYVGPNPTQFKLNTYLGDGWGAGPAGLLPTTAFAVGTWHMATVSVSAGSASYYYDGALVGTGATGGAATGASEAFSRLWIGNNSAGGGQVRGLIDEVAIFGTPLSAANVAALYAASTVTPVTVGNFSFEDAAAVDNSLVALLWLVGPMPLAPVCIRRI